MTQINERTTSYLSTQFRDKDGMLQAPTTVTYRIDCRTSGVAILPVTPVTPGSSIEIAISAEHNDIQNQGNPTEVRAVTVNGYYGVDDEVHDEFVYEIVNLHYVP